MPGSPYTDLDRPPLNEAALGRALVVPDGLWTRLALRAETGSTNTDAAGAARAGEPEGLVVVAERQLAGRGRQDRSWVSPPRAGIATSVLLRPAEAAPGRGWPPAPLPRYGWLPLLAGVALTEAVRRVADVEPVLKWPNDLLLPVPAGHAKCAGILTESVPGDGARPPAVVVGIGLNVSQRVEELPPGVGGLPATSLRLAGAREADRDPLLRALLRALAAWYARWREAGGDPEASGLRAAYLGNCATVGADVRVLLPADEQISGTATGVDDDGRLLVRAGGVERAVSAGDVLHVR